MPPSGTWDQRRAHLYQTAERWIGPEDIDREAALDHLVRRYLAAFGPAPRRTSRRGPDSIRRSRAALERLSLRRFLDEEGNELARPSARPAPRPETPAPVRFLPTWDAALLVHARRAGILPERYRPLVFSTKNPPSVPTFLVDGAVAGTWRYEKGGSVDRSSDSTGR